MNSKFATCFNCIDGRVQLPVINWITKNYEIDYVDMITEPGMDGLLANKRYDPTSVLSRLTISINKHDSNHIFIVGHFDCGANQVDEETHKRHIKKAVDRIKNYTLSCKVIGLWVNEFLQVEKVWENGESINEDSSALKYVKS
ncbi:MAG: hypothetical protein QME14_07805 [Methanobacteriaceae archaeon]|nr:hypothetical protein [Methanobacteriaceae archaeon]